MERQPSKKGNYKEKEKIRVFESKRDVGEQRDKVGSDSKSSNRRRVRVGTVETRAVEWREKEQRSVVAHSQQDCGHRKEWISRQALKSLVLRHHLGSYQLHVATRHLPSHTHLKLFCPPSIPSPPTHDTTQLNITTSISNSILGCSTHRKSIEVISTSGRKPILGFRLTDDQKAELGIEISKDSCLHTPIQSQGDLIWISKLRERCQKLECSPRSLNNLKNWNSRSLADGC
jgi:hypothetical protein